MRDEISFAQLLNLGHVRCSLKRCVCKTTINYGDKCNMKNLGKKGASLVFYDELISLLGPNMNNIVFL